MSLTIFYPKTGHVLICNFDTGFVPPEMVKKRPIVVISKTETHSRRLCTVIPLSTTTPKIIKPWHVALKNGSISASAETETIWAKCDMIYTVSFDRLEIPKGNSVFKNLGKSLKINQHDLNEIFIGVHRYLPKHSN